MDNDLNELNVEPGGCSFAWWRILLAIGFYGSLVLGGIGFTVYSIVYDLPNYVLGLALCLLFFVCVFVTERLRRAGEKYLGD